MGADARAGDTFAEHYRQHYPAVYRTVRRLVGADDAEDVVQDAFALAFRRFHTYDPDRPVGAWLHRIAVNRSISHLRRRRLGEVVTLRFLRSRQTGTSDPQESAPARVTLERALERLGPKLRAAVVLRYYHDYSYRDIAYVLGVPEGTVGSRLALALAGLRRVLGEEEARHARMRGEQATAKGATR